MARSLEAVLGQIRESAPGGLPPADYPRLARELSEHAGALQPIRLVFLSTYTTSLFTPYLVVEGARHGIEVDVFHGGFGQVEQVLLQGGWKAPAGAQEALVLAMRLEDLDPDVAFRFYATDVSPFEALTDNVLARVSDTLSLFRDASAGPALVANFAVPGHRPLSVFDAGNAGSLTRRIHALNQALVDTVTARPGSHVWDYEGLVASRGSGGWTDPRLWSLARTPVAAAHQPALAAHLMRTLRGAVRPSAKCLVVDLDDTLWGGAIGDEGIGGIRLGDEHPGSAFKRFQRAILGLRDRGIVLAICSKNDEEVVLAALRDHPEMLVRREDFAAVRVNWRPKSENLKEIAQELNIGLDSLVFFDDNPVERAEVRDRVPEVLVVEVPRDPALYVDTLSEIPHFDMTALTAEDRIRARSYQQQVERKISEQGSASLEDFLVSLEMVAEIGPLDGTTAQRIGQLVGKTNQFNLTTRRHTQAELEALAASDDAEVHWVRLKDRYGDMGLIAVGVLLRQGRDAVVDSLVLSCRAANRGIEQTLLSFLTRRARALGCDVLVGEYLPTERNHVVEDLYPRLGFEPCPEGGAGARYRLDLSRATVETPDFMVVTEPRA